MIFKMAKKEQGSRSGPSRSDSSLAGQMEEASLTENVGKAL